MAGLRDRDRELCRVEDISRDVVEAFVEEDVGEMIDNDDVVDALETLRPR